MSNVVTLTRVRGYDGLEVKVRAVHRKGTASELVITARGIAVPADSFCYNFGRDELGVIASPEQTVLAAREFLLAQIARMQQAPESVVHS